MNDPADPRVNAFGATTGAGDHAPLDRLLDGTRRVAITGGRIYTRAARSAATDAMVIEEGRVVARGAAARALVAQERELVCLDLADRILLPGFVDAHVHLLHLGHELRAPALGALASSAEVLATIRDALEHHDPARPLIAEGWDDGVWPAGDTLTGTDLDDLGTRAPVVLRRVCGHLAVLNQPALGRLRERCPDLDRPAWIDGERGLLLEDAALYCRRAFPPSASEVAAALYAALDHALALGITAVDNIGEYPQLEALIARRRIGPLRPRVVMHLIGEEMIDTRLELDAEWAHDPSLSLGGIKLYLDGSLGARTAAVHEPYADRPGERGMLLFDGEELRRVVRRVDAAGLQALLHAIGDRAIEQALDALVELGADNVRARRHRIEHVELLPPALLERLATSGATACMQPNFVSRWSSAGGPYERALGSTRMAWMNRFRAILDRDVPLAFGSDNMPMGALDGMTGAVDHPNPAERLTVAEALHAYTAGAARAAHAAADRSGTLEAGERADLAIVRQDPFDTPPGEVEIEATIVGGVIAYQAVG